jgi:hypothetical protein
VSDGAAAAIPGAHECARLRRQFVAVASRLDRTYPADESAAAVEALLGRDLARVAERARDPFERDAARGQSRAAFADAFGRYTTVVGQTPSRRLRRYLLGVSVAMGDDATVASGLARPLRARPRSLSWLGTLSPADLALESTMCESVTRRDSDIVPDGCAHGGAGAPRENRE